MIKDNNKKMHFVEKWTRKMLFEKSRLLDAIHVGVDCCEGSFINKDVNFA